ncbi:MAG: hypothetical protein PWQ67_2516 [Clostridia bacterium]|nr:hypothetical protein [Clostridia bacterium]
MEALRDELVNCFTELCPNIEPMQARIRISGILAMYDIKPAKVCIHHPDISEKVKLFLAAKKLEGLSSFTLDGYAIELRIFGNYIQKPIDKITTNDIRNFLGNFEHLKLSSIDRKLSVLKSFFGWLTGEEVITKNPTLKIKPPKKEKRLPKALSVEELEMVRENCETLRQRALVEVLYASGCRLSEIVNLNRDDIDWKNECIRVIGKGNKERYAPLNFKAMYHLKKYFKNRNDILPAVFITERKPYRRLSNRAIQREIAKIGKIAGLNKSMHPHIFRHTLAQNLLDNGADLFVVQEILGHSNPSTTQIYAHASSKHIQEQYKKYHVQ